MRKVLVALLLLVPIIPVGAQDASSETLVMDDDSNDATMAIEGNRLDDGSLSSGSTIDIISLFIGETEDDLAFRIQVQDIGSSDQQPFIDDGRIVVDFTLGDTEVTYSPDENEEATTTVPRDRFRLTLLHSQGSASASLAQFDIVRDEYVSFYSFCDTSACERGITIDEASDSWIIPIPRDKLQDADGSTPSPALRLHDFFVVSTSDVQSLSFSFVEAKDQMPNDGIPGGEFVPRLGLPPQTGHLRLSSPFPMRWSNGEETTYIFDVVLNNTEDEADEVHLTVAEVPFGWEVQLPGKSIQIAPSQRVKLPVVVSTPFSHIHGDVDQFLVEARSERDPDTLGLIELGVRYADIPQPTGHHSRIWIHAGPASNDLFSEVDGRERTNRHFMSAIENGDQDGSTDALIVANNGGGLERSEFTWTINLEPTLRTGLDFDLQRNGLVNAKFLTDGDGVDAVIFGTLYYRRVQEEQEGGFPADIRATSTTLATFYSSVKTQISAGEITVLSADLQPRRSSDYIPHRPEGAHVFLDLTLRVDSRTEYIVNKEMFHPWLIPGSTLDLPLDEYHDRVDRFYVPLTDVTMEVVGEEKRFVNSGESTAFTFTLNNSGIVNERFDLRATSLGSEWVTILDGTEAAVPSNQQHDFRVVVSAPEDAWQGQIIGPVIEAISQNDPTAKASTRFFVEVDDEQNHEDMSHLLGDSVGDDSRGLPTAPLVPLLAILGALFLTRRTRRI